MNPTVIKHSLRLTIILLYIFGFSQSSFAVIHEHTVKKELRQKHSTSKVYKNIKQWRKSITRQFKKSRTTPFSKVIAILATTLGFLLLPLLLILIPILF